MSKNLYIKTFGCQMNERDSEIMAQLLAPVGFVASSDMYSADMIILNTCSIRDKAEQKVYSLLGQIRPLKKENPLLRICVAGCVAQQEQEKIFRRMPHVDIVAGTQQIYRLPEMLKRLESGTSKQELAIELSPLFLIPTVSSQTSPLPLDQSVSLKKFVTIMQGCNNYCSYCVVPFTRGRETSRQIKDIVSEVKALVSRGVKEVTLLGQNVNSYGQTNAVANTSATFSTLLEAVADINGLQRLRFTTSNPKDLSQDLIDCFTHIPILCPQFHLPAQSGSNDVLRRMNRKYTVEEYMEKVTALRVTCPHIALSTDIIVGFPGETEADFDQTMQLLHTVRYHGSFSFKYSDRPGTRSAEFANKIPEDVKSERLQRFQAAQDSISLERNQEYIGTDVEVLVESIASNAVKGRTRTNHIVHFPFQENLQPGSFVMVNITAAGPHSLQGNAHD